MTKTAPGVLAVPNVSVGGTQVQFNSYSTDSNHIIRSHTFHSGSITVTRENEEAAHGIRIHKRGIHGVVTCGVHDGYEGSVASAALDMNVTDTPACRETNTLYCCS